MPCAKTPASNSLSDSVIASAPSPTITGVIGLSLMPVLNPSASSPALKKRVLSHRRSIQLRLVLEDVERGDARGGDRRRMRRRKEERPGAVIEKLDERCRSGDVSAQRAEGLRERADLYVHAAMHAEVIDRAASVAAEHAARVRVVHHHDAAELVGQIAELRKRAEIAIHAEHAIGDEQRALIARERRHDLSGGRDVAVREDFDGGAAQARTVDDAGVIQLVGDDHVVTAEQ